MHEYRNIFNRKKNIVKRFCKVLSVILAVGLLFSALPAWGEYDAVESGGFYYVLTDDGTATEIST